MDDKLLRDEDGHVFMDLDPYYFNKVIEYLYLAELSGDGRVHKLPFMMDNEKKIFDIYLDFFGLCKSSVDGKDDHSNTSNVPNKDDNDDKNNTSKCQEELLMSFEKSCTEEEKELSLRSKKLDELEGKLALDEKFANYFTTDAKTSVESNKTSTSTCKEAPIGAVLNLYLNGKVITVKRTILKDSYLTNNLNDTIWLEKNSMKYSDGRKAIIVKYCSTTFKCIINNLRLMAIMKPQDKLPPLQMNSKGDNVFLEECILSKLFPNKQEFSFILGKKFHMDSAIITSKSENNHIKTWLGEVNRHSDPELLYRASQDGWDVSDFHGKCDDKGATVTVVKTSEGYVFGGYIDKSWAGIGFKSSNEAFLFSLKCHGGLAPTKMKIKSGKNNDKAVYDRSSKGPIFGYDDLGVCYNHTMKKGYTNLNNTYELPVGASYTFLTGKHGSNNLFQVAEVEVFKV